MAKTRLEFHAFLRALFDNKVPVHFQPPPNTKLVYPCILYTYSRKDNLFANNDRYIKNVGYQLTVIDKDPDSTISEKIAELPFCSWDRNYAADGLNHFVYTIYY